MVSFNFNENDTSIEIHTFHISPTIAIIWAKIVVIFSGIRVVLQDQVRIVTASDGTAMIQNESEDESL